MVVENIYDTITLILNKNRRGFVKTSQKTTAIRAAMYHYFNEQVEIYRKSGFVPASIKKFVKPVTLTLASGVANLPADFVQEIVFETSCGREGAILRPEEYLDRINSSILDPDQENPIAKVENGKITVSPDEYTSIILTYIRIPNDFVYAVTVAGDGRSETFNSGGSTDIEIGVSYSNEIIKRALLYLGFAFQNNEAVQLAVNDNKEQN